MSASAALCGAVAVLGGVLPSGFLTLSGPTPRSLVRFEHGRFCAKDLEPGEYRVSVSPLSQAQPMRLARAGESVPLGPVVLKEGENELSLSHLPPAAACEVKLSASLSWTGRAPKPAERVLLAGRVGPFALDGTAPDGYAFAWVNGGAKSAELSLGPGTLASFEASGAGWALAALEPGLGDDEGSQRLACGTALAAKASLGPSAPVTGAAPAGARPALSGAPETWRAARVRSENFMGEYLADAYVAEDGRWSADGAAGARVFTARGEGPAFEQAVSIAPTGGELAVGPWAELEFEAAGLTPEAGASPQHRGERERRLVGLPAGAPFSPASLFFLEEAAVLLVQSGDGSWVRIPGSGNPVDATRKPPRVPAGRYDFYLVELQRPFSRPALRLLASRAGVELAARKRARLSLEAREAGAGSYETVLPKGAPSAARLAAPGAWRELHAALAPRVDLYDASGAWAATAFGAVSKEELADLRRAVDLADAQARVRAAAPRARPAGVTGLPGGRYRADVVVDGKVASSSSVEVAGPARAPALAGSVRYEGALVPHAVVTLEPGGHRVFTEDGRFSFETLPPGRYTARAKFQFLAESELEAGPVEVRVDKTPATLVLPLALPAPSRPATGRYRVTVLFLDPVGDGPESEPFLLAARALEDLTPVFLGVVRPDKSGRATFDMPVAEGKYVLQMQSGHWGVVYALPQTDFVHVGTEPVPLEIWVTRAGSVRGRAVLPDGSPYRPGKDHYFHFRITPDAMAFERRVEDDGWFHLVGIPRGGYVGQAFSRGAGFKWFVPGLPDVFVEPGKATDVELKLAPAVPVALATAPDLPRRAGPSPYADVRGYGFDRERWIRALDAGRALDPRAAMVLLNREYHGAFQLEQRASGWEPELSSPGGAYAAPGRYDLYLFESQQHWAKSPYVRLFGRAEGVEVREGRKAELAFPDKPWSYGDASLAGEISGVPAPSEAALSALRGDFMGFLLTLPTVTVAAPEGRVLGFAWGSPSGVRGEEAFGAFTTALAGRRFAELRRALARSTYRFEMPALAPGSYDVTVTAPGCRAAKRRVTLTAEARPVALAADCGGGRPHGKR